MRRYLAHPGPNTPCISNTPQQEIPAFIEMKRPAPSPCDPLDRESHTEASRVSKGSALRRLPQPITGRTPPALLTHAPSLLWHTHQLCHGSFLHTLLASSTNIRTALYSVTSLGLHRSPPLFETYMGISISSTSIIVPLRWGV